MPSRPRCKNCGEKLSKRGKFCPSCGQRDFNGKVKMSDLLSKFFSSLTHLDNKFVTMVWQLLVPAKVSVNYFQGKIKRYPHPVQFFFLVMFFFLIMLSKQFKDVTLNVFTGSIYIGESWAYSAAQGKDTVTVNKDNLYEAMQRATLSRQYRSAYDSLPADLKSEQTRRALDSLQRMAGGPWEEATSGLLQLFNESDTLAGNLDSVQFNFGLLKVRISTRDFVNLEPDSIIKKYRFDRWEEKVLLRQSIKAVKDQQGLINRSVGSFAWAVLVLIALMSLLLRLLYWKKGSYYVEHFIFLMHQQSGAFLFLTLVLAVSTYLFPINAGWIAVLAWLEISLLLSMHRFYKEKWSWTILKWLIYSVVYWVALAVLFISTMLLMFVLF